MSLQIQKSWEYRLLSWAQEALENNGPHTRVIADQKLLASAYRTCNAITRSQSRTFYMASGLLPLPKRQAARALYAFCRVTDDIVDSSSPVEVRHAALLQWQRRVTSAHPPAHELVALAWADTRMRYHIPWGYAEQLIQGVARDLNQNRYDTFDDLAEYAYGVASTVGLMAMHIIGFEGEQALPYAVKLGVALQITNILRDVGEDWRAGRLYLPHQELQAFQLSEADITSGQVDDRWRTFMAYQIERNRQLYKESRPGIKMLDPDGRFAIAAAAALYEAILEDIEAHDYDVFNRRSYVTMTGKVLRLPGIWRQSLI